MNFRPRRAESPEMNLTPLIDVVFLLLIFFMVTTTFNQFAELRIDLPEAESARETPQKQTLELAIDAQGRYFLDGQELVNPGPETLREALRRAISGDTEMPVIIRADAKTPHQAVVTAMDAVGRVGLTRLSIATSRADAAD